ncbi:D-alanine:D-lactate ligase-like protein [Mesorhizobium sp. NBSH29]|uniref:D-alanine:D-lactate ligase-like protein n=1 Tax=Mesorhizobium sp. NBSH29 TaxID=2654249 RepID=UPI0018965973|nr:D-alanine:D-lactate ligase-like protein [Mesorhizobium sp. NBSH29]QPC87195.1 D-alanine:D-lactate ligase-like protein [Mesorhizobium sp. NBSH29]
MPTHELILVYEPEAACLARLVAAGMARARAGEIASYLAQSTDLALEFDAISDACAARGIVFRPVELDRAASVLGATDPAHAIVWTLTDGIAYFRGSAAPALARLGGVAAIGSDDSLFALCQDKFRAGAVLAALGLPVPAGGLARDGVWLAPAPASPSGYFVKPNRLGAKIGIWKDSRCTTEEQALALSRRIFAAYGDDAIVQPYVAGQNARASFLAVSPAADARDIGSVFVDAGGDFQTMEDSLALYGETRAQARSAGAYFEPALAQIAATRPQAAKHIEAIGVALMEKLGLRDVFSYDLRLEADDTVHLIEFEVCPGLPCFDFRAYCKSQWGLTLAEAMTDTAANRLLG